MGKQQSHDHAESRNAAWCALWQRLLKIKREELPQHIHSDGDNSLASQNGLSSNQTRKREVRASK
jgi:hypothetical protein